MVRLVRRRIGVSQRELARRSGVSLTTVIAVESGKQQPSLRVLAAIVELAGLEVSLDRPVQPLCRHVVRHLHRSLPARLHLALGGSGWPRDQPVLPAWRQLGLLATSGHLFVTGELAAALWLPVVPAGAPAVARPRVGLDPWGSSRLPVTPDVEVVLADLPRSCTVTVPLSVGALRTPSPSELALDPALAGSRRALRGVAAELERQAPGDLGGRRSPAHREPRREEEAWRLLFARRWSDSLRPPDSLDARGWRLDDEVGMRHWIERRAGRG